MASIYDEPINKHVDWGGDASTGNQPVSGRQVQNFIKTGLESKVGDTYYDSITGLYLQFADAENREIYLTDRITYADLLLGSFEGFAPYVVYTELVSPTEKAILYGSTGVTLDFRFQIQDSSGSPLSDGIKVVYTFNNSGSTRTATKFFNAGSGSTLGVASFNVDEYLSEGTNDISVKISGRNTTASKTLVYTWTVVNLQLTTSFSVSSQIAPTDSIAIPYYIKGLGTKHVQFYIDSVLYPTEDVIADAELSKIFYIPNTWASGKHTLQIRAYMTIGSENFYSYTLYREFVISGATGKWITFAYDFTPGTLIQSDLSNLVFNEKQYEAVSINWGYIASDLLDRTINWYLDDVKVAVREGTSGVLSPLSFVPTIAKITNQDLKAYIEGETIAIDTYKMFVAENTEIREETDALGLKLSAFGKYNSDADHASWTYNGITTDFTNVEWTDLSGWNGQALVLQNGAAAQVNYKPFDSNHPAVSYGLTFEIEFETFNVDDESAVVASVATGTHGIQITSNSATLTSDAGTVVKTNFKDGEKVKLAFIINQREGVQLAHLTYIQNNGILERAVSYATNDTYTNSAFIQLGGSNQAGIKVYSIRSYYKALTTIQEFNNFAIDSNDVAAVLARNDVYIPGTTTVSVEKMQGILPVLLFTGPIHILLESTSKETTITGDFSFTNPQDPTKNWWGTGMQMKLQGTSSLRYPRKNFKIYMKKGNNPTVFDYEGNQITDWAMKARAVPCHTFTLKADFSDSSCTHNATVARLYGDLEPNVVVNGSHLLRTPPQVCAYEGQFEQATGKQFPYDLRTTPDSFAMVMFYRENDSDDYTFAGQYNFLNDKGNEFVYGFRSIYANGDNPWDKTAPKLWDNVNTHCFEVLNNTDSTGLCEWTDSTLFFVEDPQNPGHSYWEQTWESRYPEAEGTETKEEMDALAQSLYQLHSWMSSCYKTPLDNPLEWGGAEAKAKFYNEQADHLDLNKCASYYSYFMRFGAVDQVNKNMMITTYDGVHWFPIRYDNDTILGQRNDGRLIYDYTITRQTEDPETHDYAYAGHASWFWNALEAQNNVQTYPYGFMTSYVPDVDAGLYSAGLTYDATVQYFDVTTSDKWCERIYNDNGTYKYISPFIGSEHQDYLYALQGKRQSHRHWWLRNRFDLYDAKFVTGDYSSKNINFTVPGTPSGSVVILKPGKTNYYGYGINKVPQETGVYGEKGQALPITFTMPRQLAVGDPIYLYAANCIEELDLHQFCSHFTTFDLSGAYDETIGTKLKKLTLGDVNNPNSSNVAFSGFANMSRLEYLDISGFAGNNTFDLTGLSSLKTFIALGSGLTLFNCPAGLNFNELRLPQTVTGITMDQVTWDALHFEFTPTNTLNYVSFSRMKGANVRNFLTTWIDNIKNGGTYVGKTLNLSVPKDDPWENMKVNHDDTVGMGPALLELAKFDVHSIRGRFIIGRQITSEEMTALTDAFGPTIWDPNAPLVIDAVESVVIGCDKSHLYAGETAQFTAVSFPVGGIQHAVHFEIVGVTESGTAEDPIYVKDNAILHKLTGVLETTENNTPDNTFTVFAIDEVTGTADDMSYTVYRRSYPTAVAITGPTAILAIGTYEFTAVPSPAGTNGTLQSFEWFVTERPYLNVLSRTAEKLTLQVLNVPSTYDVNVVSVALTYKNGVALPASHNFIAHDKVKIVDSQSNYNLAVALNELGVSASPLLTWDIEAYLWDQTLNLNDCEHGPSVTSFLGSTANRVYKYFANATKFDFNGIVNLDDQHNDIDLTNNVALTEVDFSGTALEGIVWGPALTKANIPTVKRINVPANTVAFNTTDVTFTPEEITHIELHNSPFTQQTTYGDALNWFYFEIYKKQVPSVLPEPTSTYYCYYNSNNSILYSDSVKVTSNYYDDDIQTGLYELTDATLDRGVFESVTNPNVNHVTGIDTNCTAITGNILAGSTSLVNFRADYAASVNGMICKNCTALTTVSLLSCTTAYESEHFKGCTSLKNVFAPSLNFASGQGLNAFENTGIEAISQALTQPTAGVWLRNLTVVPSNCFSNCLSLVDAQLPNVTTVGTEIFYHCIRLESGSLASCANLGVSTFEDCWSLEVASKTHLADAEFVLCDSLEVVPNKCFKTCRGLKRGSFVTNTSTCNSFGEECFAGCTSLACVFSSDEIREGIRVGINTQLAFGDKCFLGCISLESAIVNFAHSFGAYCFAGCTAVADLHTYPQAPAVQGNTFGDGTEAYPYMGSGTGSVNLLYLLADHSGYNVSPWSDVVLNASKCHFQITTEQASCTITYRASYRLTDVENKPNITSVSWTPSPVPGQDGTGVIAMNVASIPGSFFDTNMSHMYLHEVDADCIQLGSWAFARCTALTTVSLTACGTLGGYCFYLSGITAFNGDNVLYLNGDSQFSNCMALVTASFRNLSAISSSMFYGCTALVNTDFNSVITINSNGFYRCASLQTVNLPACITIGTNAFYHCSALTTVNAPNCAGVQYQAFMYCSSLSSFVFDNIEYIGSRDNVDGAYYDVFYGTALVDVYAPNCVGVGRRSFGACNSLNIVNLPACTAIGQEVFDASSVKEVRLPILQTPPSRLFYWYNTTSSLATVNVPALTTVGYQDFYRTYALQQELDCSHVTALSSAAFRASGLTRITHLDNITTIPDNWHDERSWYDEGVFDGSPSLTFVDLPAQLTHIGNLAFRNCSALEDINLSTLTNVTRIGYAAFYNCNKLGSGANQQILNMPNLTTLDSIVFYNAGLTGIENLGTLTSIAGGDGNGRGVFHGCTLQYAKLPKCLKTIGSYAFAECKYLTSVNFYDLVNLLRIEWNAFGYSGSTQVGVITSPVSLPNLTDLSNRSFYRQSISSIDDLGKLTILHRPDNDYAAFRETMIRSLVVPKTMARMEYNNFRGCNQLRYITALGNTPAVVDNSTDNSTWYGCNANLKKVAVPAGFKEDYKTAWEYLTQSTFCELPYDDSEWTLVVYNFGLAGQCTVLDSTATVTNMEVWDGDEWIATTVATEITITEPGFIKVRFKSTGSVLPAIAKDNALRIWTATNILSVAASAFANAPMLSEFHGTNVTTLGVSAFSHCEFMQVMELPALTTLNDSCLEYLGIGVVGGDPVLKTLIFGQTQPVCPSSMANPFLMVPDANLMSAHDCQTGDGWDWQGTTHTTQYYYWEYLAATRGWSHNPITINFHSMVDLEIPITGEVTGYSYDATEQIGYITLSTATPTSNPFAGNTNVEVLWGDNQIYSLPTDFVNGCSALRYVWFPTVTTLGTGALQNATMLRTVVLPRLTAIPNDGFNGDGGLYDKIHFDRVVTVGDRAFYNCSNMHSIDLPVCTSVGTSAFENTELVSINMPALQTVGATAFKDTPAYEALLPACTTIGSNAFQNCSELITIEVGTTQPVAQANSFADTALNGTIHHNVTNWNWSADGWSYLHGRGWDEVLPYIEYVASAQLVIDEEHYVGIADHTYDPTTHTGLIILNTKNPICENFEGQDTVTEVTLSSVIESLPSRYFYGCQSLVQINMNLGQIPVASNTFVGVASTGMIRVFDYADWNRQAPGWDILLGPTGGWDFDNRVLYYTAAEKAVLHTEEGVEYHIYDSFLQRGAIKMTNATPTTTPLRNNVQATEIHGLFTTLPDYFVAACDAESISFPYATSVGAYALSGCSNVLHVELNRAITIGAYALQMDIKLLSCTLGAAQTIGAYAFYRDYAVSGINTSTFVSIGEKAFNQCYAITSLNSLALQTIGNYAFQNCVSLTEFVCQAPTSIGTSAFESCTSLATVTIPSGLTVLNNTVFYHCTSLTTLSFPTVTTIGNNCFDGCRSLTQCLVPSVVTVGYKSFYQCTALVTLGPITHLTSIGSEAFYGCSKLTNTINFATVTNIGNYPFDGCYAFTGAATPTNLQQSGIGWFYNARLTSADFTGNTTLTVFPTGDWRGTFNNEVLLQSVTMPTNLTYLGSSTSATVDNNQSFGTFGRCYALRSIGPTDWQSKIKRMSYDAFWCTHSLHLDVNMPELEFLGNRVFDSTGIVAVENLGKITRLNTYVTNTNSIAYNRQLSYVKLPTTLTDVGHGFLYGCFAMRNLYVPSFTPLEYNYYDGAGASYRGGGALRHSSFATSVPNLHEIRIPCGSYEEYYYWDEGTTADSFDYWSSTESRQCLVEGPYEETEWHTVAYDVSGSFGQPMTIINSVANVDAMQVRELAYNPDTGQYGGAAWIDIDEPGVTRTFARRPAGTGATPRLDSGIRIVRYKLRSGLSNEFAGITTIKRVYTPSAVLSSSAFAGCTGLVTIKVPNAQTFGTGVFTNCSSLSLIEVDAQPVASSDTFSGVGSNGVVRIYGTCDFTATGWSSLVNWTSKDRTIVRLKSVADLDSTDPRYYTVWTSPGSCNGPGLYEKGEVATLECRPGFRVPWDNVERRMYDFVAWSDGETSNPHSPITMDSDKEINAIVRDRRFRLNVTEQGASGGQYTISYPFTDENGNGYFTWDNAFTVNSVSAPSGYKFESWRVWNGGGYYYTREWHPTIDADRNATWHRIIGSGSDVITIILNYVTL